MKIGILGGGQLGKMLFEASPAFDIELYFLENDINAPCSGFKNAFQLGNILDENDVYNFGKNMDIISIEIENVNIYALKRLENEGKKVFPQPHIIALIQDKGTQKQFYQQHNIPTSEFELVKDNAEKKLFFEHLTNIQKGIKIQDFVQKMRTGGYDGKGVQVLKTKEDLDNQLFDVPCILEKKVDIQKEIAVIVARNPKGEIKTFPAVEMVFNPELNLVDYLLSPADITQNIAQEAENIAKNIIEKLEMVGILAVEMFLDKQNNILVNEIAPRPHNSGHHTIEGNKTSQYTQHLNAILDLDLGNTSFLEQSVMLNILGENGYEGIAKYENLDKIEAIKGIFVHLYNKKITKSGRKMGHVTILDNNKNNLLEKMNFVKENLKVTAI
jgi:5-(carboxyamino)imidazole ribonucleotide synthase